ncbi:hypothetical protein F5Y14DRAFT_184250 [Nemania sp. NC0429]|nr:hypothetical protein F5Y14DRAFT_184250 [Nemania sp. NC0429]
MRIRQPGHAVMSTPLLIICLSRCALGYFVNGLQDGGFYIIESRALYGLRNVQFAQLTIPPYSIASRGLSRSYVRFGGLGSCGGRLEVWKGCDIDGFLAF